VAAGGYPLRLQDRWRALLGLLRCWMLFLEEGRSAFAGVFNLRGKEFHRASATNSTALHIG
jgi:hypothetical protein